MERRAPLVTRTPLTGKPLARGSKPLPLARDRLRRGTPTPKTPPSPSTRRSRPAAPKAARPSQDTRAVVIARDGGRCVRCGQPATNVDHVLDRGMGGTRSKVTQGPAWLRSLCGSGNVAGCHGWKSEDRDGQATRWGYALPRNGVRYDAAKVPVLTHYGWRYFNDDGTVSRAPTPPGADARNTYDEARLAA